MHKCYGFKNKTKGSLLPFVIDSQLDTEERKKSFIEKELEGLEELELSQRVKRLEKIILFLEEYIVNTSLLDSIRTELNQTKAA